MSRTRRILCATDFSKTSTKAMASAIDMAKVNRARLTLIHVYTPIVPMVPEQYIASQTWEQIDTEARRWAQRQLASLADKAKKSGVRATALIATGEPAHQIVRVARSTKADLIVIGTHGRRGVSNLLLGSVAERVIRTARCPVMTVRGPQ